MHSVQRRFAAAAVVAATAGAVGLCVAVAGSAPFRYVSESGVAGAPHALLYRVSMVLFAVALALLAVPARSVPTRSMPARSMPARSMPTRHMSARGMPALLRPEFTAVAWLSLALAAPLATVSAAVTCSPGCPLPPYESPAPRDLVHAAGAIGALLLCALVMLVYATQPDPSSLRRAGRLGVLVAFPPLLLSAFGIVFVGRGLFTGVAERGALVAVSVWLVLTAALHVREKA